MARRLDRNTYKWVQDKNIRHIATITITVVLIVIVMCTGCLPKPNIVKHPDSPMLIEEVRGSAAKVSVYDSANKRLIQYGWVELKELKGWTLHKYDWEKFIKRKKNEGR